MEHLITLLSWSFFPLLSQKSSIIYAPVSDRLGALLPRCESRSLRFSSLPQWPTWCVPKWEFVKWTARWPTWRAASRLRRSSQVCPAAARSCLMPSQMCFMKASAVWSKQVATKVSHMWAIRKWRASFSGPKLWRTTLSLRRLLLVVITVTLTRRRNAPRRVQIPQVRRTNRLFLFPCETIKYFIRSLLLWRASNQFLLLFCQYK